MENLENIAVQILTTHCHHEHHPVQFLMMNINVSTLTFHLNNIDHTAG